MIARTSDCVMSRIVNAKSKDLKHRYNSIVTSAGEIWRISLLCFTMFVVSCNEYIKWGKGENF